MSILKRALLSLLPARRVTVPRERAYAPHCDPSILHAPGMCEHCDHYSDWQDARIVQRISFTGDPERNNAPCPSEYFRSGELRDQWPGNRASNNAKGQ